MNEVLTKDWPRLVISALIMVYFGYSVFAHWSTGLEETIKNLVMIVTGFWVGSSKGSSDKSEQIQQMQADNAEGGK